MRTITNQIINDDDDLIEGIYLREHGNTPAEVLISPVKLRDMRAIKKG